MRRHATQLETVRVEVPEHAVEAYEAALGEACGTVGFFLDEDSGIWTLEGVKQRGENEAALAAALAVAGLVSGYAATLTRQDTEAEGWLARSYQGFPEQAIGRRFAVRGTHIGTPRLPGRVTLVLDASAAFGSGEHGSTRGCLRALEAVAHRRPGRIRDVGTGTGILAMAAAKLLHRRVLGSDIDPWSVRVSRGNARRNGLAPHVRFIKADGWRAPAMRGPWDLVFANILARPLCRMAPALAAHLAPGGTAILAGLLREQVRWVVWAHREQGLVLERVLHEGRWAALVLRRRGAVR